MKKSERYVANVWIQLSLAVLLTMYACLVRPHDPASPLWYAIAVALGLLGAFRQLPVAVAAAMAAVAVYGGVTAAQLLVFRTLAEPAWHHFAWLVIFPCAAMAGGLNREDRLPKLIIPDAVLDAAVADGDGEVGERETLALDEQWQFRVLAKSDFLAALQDLAMSGWRAKSTFHVMLTRIRPFGAFRDQYGEEQARHLLERTASILHETMKDALLKAYLGDGTFAVAVPGDGPLTPLMIQMRLDNRFRVMMMARARRDMVHVRLVHGSSEFPLHGMSAEELYRRAELGLEEAGKEA